MTNRQLGILITSIGAIALVSVGFPLWYSQLSPLEKCWTQSCREEAFSEELDAIEARYAPIHEANQRDLDAATQAVEQHQRNIQEIDHAVATLECHKKGHVC